MSDPKIWNLEEVFSLSKSYEPNKVDFLFHCNHENNGRTNNSSIIPLYKDQLALIQKKGGKKMKGISINKNPSSSCIFDKNKGICMKFLVKKVGRSA